MSTNLNFRKSLIVTLAVVVFLMATAVLLSSRMETANGNASAIAAKTDGSSGGGFIAKPRVRFAALEGSRKPAALEGYRRPAALDGGRRPAALDGRKTPASLDGRKSPASLDGRKSPASLDGRKSPASLDGRKTPASLDGRKTPASLDGRRTPASLDGRRTPAMLGGRKPPAALAAPIATQAASLTLIDGMIILALAALLIIPVRKNSTAHKNSPAGN